jgi:hypothetical protein
LLRHEGVFPLNIGHLCLVFAASKQKDDLFILELMAFGLHLLISSCLVQENPAHGKSPFNALGSTKQWLANLYWKLEQGRSDTPLKA